MKKEEIDFDFLKEQAKKELEKEYTSFAGFLGVLVRTANPLSYKKLSHGSYKDGLRYFFHLLLLSYILFFLLTIPHLLGFYSEFRSATTQLNNFTLVPQLEVNQILSFDSFDLIIANEKEYDGEALLITQKSVSWPNTWCLLFKPACFFYEDDPEVFDSSRAQDMVDDGDALTKWVFGLLLLLLPGILIATFIYLIIKYVLMILVFFVLGYIWAFLLRMEIHLRQLFLIALYSLSLSIVVETVLSAFYDTYSVPYLLSFVLFLLSTYITAEKPFHHRKGL